MKPPGKDLPPALFTGFAPEALRFFRALAKHQDRDWFAAHKAEYEKTVRVPLAALVVELSAKLAAAGSPLCGDPKTALFRIYRDVRFTPDKRPYQTHGSCVLTRGGEKHAPGVLYFHLDPAGSFVAAGFYQAETDALRRMREHLADLPADWRKVERALANTKLELSREDALKRLPRGFEDASPELADALRLKSWVVRRTLTDTEVSDAGLLDRLAAFAQDAAPLLRFGWASSERR